MMSSLHFTSSTNDTWTDEFYDDDFTGVGVSNYKIYSKQYDLSTPNHMFMHKHFSLSSNDHYIYGILTGFNYLELNEDKIRNVFSHITTYLTLELTDKLSCIPDQLQDSHQEDLCYGNILKDAFQMSEESIRRLLSDVLSEKTVLDISLSGNNREDYPKINDKFKELARELSLGFSCVVLMMNSKRIYVANIGDTRAILCRKVLGDSGQDYIRYVELSTRHDLENPEEVERLKNINIDVAALRQSNIIGNSSLTRCLGNLWLKCFYKDYDELSKSSHDPVLSEPSIDSFPIDDSCLFFILASASLIQTLQEALDKEDVIDDLLQLICEKLQNHSDLKRVSQAVVDEISKKHHNRFYESIKSSPSRPACRQIEDITLLLRDLRANSDDSSLDSSFPNNLNALKISDGPEKETLDMEATTVDGHRTLTAKLSTQSEVNIPRVDQQEIEPYVDFTELLVAFNEIKAQNTV